MNALIGAVVVALLTTLLGYFFGLERSRHERLEEKRALVIADLSRLLFEVQDTFSHWAHLSLHSEPYEHVANRQEQKGKAAVESNNELIRCYQANAAWLHPETAAKLERFLVATQEFISTYSPDLRNVPQQWSPESRKAVARMRDEIPLLKEDLIREFRATLYPISWWQKVQKVFPYRIKFNPPQQ